MKKYSIRNTEQPNPITNDLPAIQELVIVDLEERLAMTAFFQDMIAMSKKRIKEICLEEMK